MIDPTALAPGERVLWAQMFGACTPTETEVEDFVFWCSRVLDGASDEVRRRLRESGAARAYRDALRARRSAA